MTINASVPHARALPGGLPSDSSKSAQKANGNHTANRGSDGPTRYVCTHYNVRDFLLPLDSKVESAGVMGWLSGHAICVLVLFSCHQPAGVGADNCAVGHPLAKACRKGGIMSHGIRCLSLPEAIAYDIDDPHLAANATSRRRLMGSSPFFGDVYGGSGSNVQTRSSSRSAEETDCAN